MTLVFEHLSAPQLENALADVKDLHQQTLDRQAQISALRFQLEKELQDTLEKLDGLGKKCQEQDDRIKQLREELASNHKLLALLADNKMKDDEIIASGKAEIVSLKAKVLKVENKLSEAYKAHENELSKIKAENAVLKAQLGNTLSDVKDLPASSFSLTSTLKR
jgi:chromosome segregation ATPase